MVPVFYDKTSGMFLPKLKHVQLISLTLIWAAAFYVPTRVFPQIAEYPDIVISGQLWADGRRSDISGQAAVCNMNTDTPIYVDFDANSDIVLTAPPLALVMLTGRFSDDRAWVELAHIKIELSHNGILLPEQDHQSIDIIGWLQSDTLCNFFQ